MLCIQKAPGWIAYISIVQTKGWGGNMPETLEIYWQSVTIMLGEMDQWSERGVERTLCPYMEFQFGSCK